MNHVQYGGRESDLNMFGSSSLIAVRPPTSRGAAIFELNNEIKNIHLYQRKLYTNFINHIEFLNNAKNTTVNDTVKIVDKSRMTKLVNK